MKLSQVFAWYCGERMFWVRFLGIGIAIIDKTKHPPLFSERYGYEKVLRVGKFGIEFLPKLKGLSEN